MAINLAWGHRRIKRRAPDHDDEDDDEAAASFFSPYVKFASFFLNVRLAVVY